MRRSRAGAHGAAGGGNKVRDAQEVELMIKGFCSDLPDDQKAELAECKARIQAVMDEYGSIGILAVGLLGAGLAAVANED